LEVYLSNLQKEVTGSHLHHKLPPGRVIQRIENGPLDQALKDLDAEEQIDLVVLTAHQESGLRQNLISREMLDLPSPGAIVVDLAVEQGGNCEFSEPGKWVDYKNVSIGALNLPAMLLADASQLYAHNLYNFFRHVYPP
jgi:H+-translocating NAD(P) transhydrogenase subunit alpha